MNMKMLRDYKVLSYKSHTGDYVYGKAKFLSDEGSFYRIGDTHVLKKYGVASIDKNGNVVSIAYNDGNYIELCIC